MLALRGVTKTYSRRDGESVMALHDVDLDLTAGEFVTVVGPSGSGKSTLLFTIGAMLRPTAGSVCLGGTDIYSLPASRRTALRQTRIGFMFQTFNLMPYLSCLENVALPGILAGSSRRESMSRAQGMLERLGLAHRISHRPAELSVGERQRVALCRSLINEPELLLADEPTGNLDDEMGAEVCQLLQELNRGGQTIVVATHDQQLASIGTAQVRLVSGHLATQPSAPVMA